MMQDMQAALERVEARKKRQAGVEHARSEARLEGQDISPEAQPLFQQYVDGELTRDELRAKIIALYTGR